MATIKIEVSESFMIKGAGAELPVNIAAYSQEALDYIFMYGFNRAHQDRANSMAKAARDEGSDVDGMAILTEVANRIAEAKFNQRGTGGGFDETARAMIGLARKAAKASDEKKYKNMKAGERDQFVWGYIGSLSHEQQTTLAKAAQQKVEMDRMQAELAKGLDLKIDL